MNIDIPLLLNFSLVAYFNYLVFAVPLGILCFIIINVFFSKNNSKKTTNAK